MASDGVSDVWVREPDGERIAHLGSRIRDWLDPADWTRWSVGTRVNYVAAANDWIRSAYGLAPRTLLFQHLPPTVRGRFSPESGDVALRGDRVLMDDPVPLLRTLAHENRHASQFMWMTGGSHERGSSGPTSTEVSIWREAWSTYSRKNYDRYRYNPLEVDAREAGHHLVAGFQSRDSQLLRQELAARMAPAVRRSQPVLRRRGERPGREMDR